MHTINFRMLKPEELVTFTTRILPFIKLLIAMDSFLAEFYPKIERKMNDLSQALVMIRGSVFTPQIADSDTWRDRRFLGLRYYITAFTFHPDEKIAQAAEYLLAIIDARGSTLYTYGYAEETAQLNGLLEDLETPKAKEAIALIKGESWVNDVAAAQKNFEALYHQKVVTEATQNLPRVKASKEDLIRNLSRLLVYIETNLDLNPEKYQPVAEKIDEVIVDVMTIARTRKTKQNEKTKPQQA